MKVWTLTVACAAFGLVLANASLALARDFNRGFDVFPWIYRARTQPDDPTKFIYDKTFPNIDIYTQYRFDQLRAMGADTIRVQFEPTPFLVADASQRAGLIDTMLAAIDRVTNAGLTAIIAPFPREAIPAWSRDQIVKSPEKFAAYKTMITDLTTAVARRGGDRTILETMNEPPGGYSVFQGFDWFALQTELVKAIRAVAPSLRILVSGDLGSDIKGLLRLDPRPINDPNVLYTFHYYEPLVLTHQGATWGASSYRADLSGLEYPVVIAQRDEALSSFKAKIDDDGKLADKATAWKQGSAAINAYFDTPVTRDTIKSEFAKVTDWAKRYGISPDRIILGEFGAMRPGASLETAVNYSRDIRELAEEAGFAWIYHNYAPYFTPTPGDFSVLRMRDPDPNGFDSQLIEHGLGMKMK